MISQRRATLKAYEVSPWTAGADHDCHGRTSWERGKEARDQGNHLAVS